MNLALQVAESSGCLASAVFFPGPPSYPVVLAADAGILVRSGCLAQDVREPRSQDNSDSCAIALRCEMTHFSLFPIFAHLSRRLWAGVDFCGALEHSQLLPESPGVHSQATRHRDCAN